MADWLREQGYRCDTAAAVAARPWPRSTARSYDLVLVDIRLGDGDGFDLLAHCRSKQPATAVIMITGYGTVEIGHRGDPRRGLRFPHQAADRRGTGDGDRAGA